MNFYFLLADKKINDQATKVEESKKNSFEILYSFLFTKILKLKCLYLKRPSFELEGSRSKLTLNSLEHKRDQGPLDFS